VPFRTATLKTLTAFNFRWPSILFSLVWTTLPRTEAPFALRHAPHAFAKEITCPLPPSYRFRPLLSCPFAPFLLPVPVCSRSHRVLRSSKNVRLRSSRFALVLSRCPRCEQERTSSRERNSRDEADSSRRLHYCHHCAYVMRNIHTYAHLCYVMRIDRACIGCDVFH